MTLHFLGREDARAELDKFHRLLNQKGIVPPQYYDRDNSNHLVVALVSQIVALCVSDNYEPIPAFIGLCHGALLRDTAAYMPQNYRQIVDDYLFHVSYFLKCFVAFDTEPLSLHIPHSLLVEGFKRAPRFNAESLQFQPCW